MSKHSLGPWKMKFKKDCDWTVRSADGYDVLAIPHDEDHGRPSEDACNALLISASPDMYAALKKILPLLEAHNGAPWKEARALALKAIEKAEGK